MKFRNNSKPAAIFLVGAAFISGLFFGSWKKSYAIPSYARQLGVSCDQCHTIWPRLNKFGRLFKVKGYVDQGANPGFPLAARVMATAEEDINTPPGGPSATSSVINFPSQVNVFAGTRISPQLGIFSAFTLAPVTDANGGREWKASIDEQKIAYNFLKGKEASLVFFHSTIFGFDPFPSLGNLAFMGDYFQPPSVMNNGELLAPFDTTGFGVAATAFLDKGNHFYGAIGVETGGAAPDTLGLGIGANDTSGNALDTVARVAYQEDVGDSGGSFNIGAAYYAGDVIPVIQLPTTGGLFGYRGHVNRYFIDGALELPVNENDLFEIVALYGNGSDRNFFQADQVLGATGPFDANVSGGYVEANFFWDRKIGLRALYDNSTVGNLTTSQWQVGTEWLPLKDFKLDINAGPASDNTGAKTMTYQLILTKMF